MKAFSFNHNDYVSVTLTTPGALHLSKKSKDFYDAFSKLQRGKEVFVEGEIYKAQFWSLVSDFNEMLHLGMESPFYLGTIRVDSSMES